MMGGIDQAHPDQKEENPRDRDLSWGEAWKKYVEKSNGRENHSDNSSDTD